MSQTLSHLLRPLAYSRWGIWKREGPALLVSAMCLYSLTLSRLENDECPFGLNLLIEKTANERMMEWALQNYIQSSIADYKSLHSMTLIMPLVVDPRLWTPMNIMAEFEMVPLQS